MTRALVLQLSSQLKEDFTMLSKLRESYIGTLLPQESMMDVLQALCREFDHIYVILDALDEAPKSDTRGEVLQAVVTIRQRLSSHLHLLVTSRDEPDIREALNVSPNEDISMRNTGVEADIANFISDRLNDDPAMRKWLPAKTKIEQALLHRAKGV